MRIPVAHLKGNLRPLGNIPHTVSGAHPDGVLSSRVDVVLRPSAPLQHDLIAVGIIRRSGQLYLHAIANALRRDDRSSFGRVRTPVHNRHLARRLKHAMGSGIGDLRPNRVYAQRRQRKHSAGIRKCRHIHQAPVPVHARPDDLLVLHENVLPRTDLDLRIPIRRRQHRKRDLQQRIDADHRAIAVSPLIHTRQRIQPAFAERDIPAIRAQRPAVCPFSRHLPAVPVQRPGHALVFTQHPDLHGSIRIGDSWKAKRKPSVLRRRHRNGRFPRSHRRSSCRRLLRRADLCGRLRRNRRLHRRH